MTPRIAVFTSLAILLLMSCSSSSHEDSQPNDAKQEGVSVEVFEDVTQVQDSLGEGLADDAADLVGTDTSSHETIPDVPGDMGPAPLECPPLPVAKIRTLDEAMVEGALVPGEVLNTTAGAPFVLPAATGTEEYLVMLYDLGTARNSLHSYTVEITPEPDRHTTALSHAPVPIWKHLAQQCPERPEAPGKLPPTPPPEPGDIVTFQVPFGMLVLDVEAKAMLVTDSVVIYNDITTENPLEDVTLETMQQFAELFETVVQPREHFFWGKESDVNGDGKVDLLFSHLVNQSEAYAFVSHCDLLDPGFCGFGNEREVIYVAIPDPEEKIHSPEAYAELIAHEFNHSIYFAHKFLFNDQPEENENIYITEGMSGLAQDLTGYNRGNQFVASAGLSDVNDISAPDLHRFEPGAQYDPVRDGALRGASYLFLRYVFDQADGESMEPDGTFLPSCGSQLLHRWVNSPFTGPDLVEEVTGLSYETVIANWFTALAVSNRPGVGTGGKVDPVYQYLPTSTDPVTGNQRGMDLWGMVMGFYKLTGPAVQPIGDADGKLREGGVEYLLVKPTSAGDITLNLLTGTAPSPHVRVVRIDLP